MAELRTLQNKRLTDLTGRVFETPPPPIIELEIYGDKWVPNNHPTIGQVQFYSKGQNTAYIDYGDGSPVETVTIPSAGWVVWNRLNNVHLYPRKDYWKVKIWFLKPELISQFIARYVELVGKFPSQLALYPIRYLRLFDDIKFEEFPDDIAPGFFDYVELSGVVKRQINHIPKWIYLSHITDLRIGSDINFADVNTSNLDKLINCIGLERLDIGAYVYDDSIPDNFKDFSYLKYLHLKSSFITKIPDNVLLHSGINTLRVGYGDGPTGGNSSIITWGSGFQNMVSLATLSCHICPNITTDFPDGLQFTKIKSYGTGSSFITTSRIDEAINSAYQTVIAHAAMEEGNTTLRQVFWLNGGSHPYTNAVPSGLFQPPVGFIKGVSNGTPSTPMEKVYVLAKQYKWTVRLNTSSGYNDFTHLS